MATADPSFDRSRVLQALRRHGWNATAFQTLGAGFLYFFHGDDACVAYVDTGRAWVAAGAPIAPDDSLVEVARGFVTTARARGRRAVFFASEDRLRIAAGDELRTIRIGEQPLWNPARWESIVERHASLRQQLRRARAKSVMVRRIDLEAAASESMREAMSSAAERWLATRGLAPMTFLVGVQPLELAEDSVVFVAEREGTLVGFAGLVPVPVRHGWFLKDLVRDPAAPNGTGELLVDAAMRWAAEGGSPWLTLGLAPLAGEVAAPLRWARQTLTALYNFEGLRAFKAKLRPTGWMPIYLAYPPGQRTIASLLDGLSAFTRRGLLDFALRSLMRRLRRRR